MIINLAENKNPYLPTKKMLDEIKRWIPEISHYPPIDDSILCNKMGEFFHIDSNCIVFLNGSMEGINYLTKYFFKKRMTLFVPTFWGYKYCANKFNVNVTEIPLENCLHYSLDDIDYYAKKSDFIFLCNPNNPTLDILPSKKLISIIFNNPNCHFIIDETMLCFSKFFSDTTMISEISKMKNLSVLLSYSKVLGIAGLRSGVLFTNKNIAEWIKKERSPFCMNKITYKFLSKYPFEASLIE